MSHIENQRASLVWAWFSRGPGWSCHAIWESAWHEGRGLSENQPTTVYRFALGKARESDMVWNKDSFGNISNFQLSNLLSVMSKAT